MDPISSIVDGQQAALMSQIQFAVAAKVLQTEKLSGNAAVQLIQAASGTAETATSDLQAGANGIVSSLNVVA